MSEPMTSKKPRRAVPFRLIAAAAPPVVRDGRRTVFGLQDRDQVLHPGTPGAGGTLIFNAAVEAREDPAGGVRFYGPFVHGRAPESFLYVGWRYEDAGEWVRRQKIPLAGIAAELTVAVQEATPCFVAEIPSITAKCATIPVVWRRETGG